MTRKRKPGTSALSDEDQTLWDLVKKTAKPIHGARPPAQIARPVKPKASAPITPRDVTRDIQLFELEIGRHTKVEKGHNLAPTLTERLAKAPLRMDRKHFAKMRKGKVSPEARIDLHGMTMAQAHPALTRFILTACAMDRRLVLVITGKGKHRDDEGPIPMRKGVLKHQVPHWLQTPPLREAVLQVAEAHLKHGGSGAYYVYLRRQK
ncbi:MAG: Smr/MutS family protein [Alphaproteobacteria bacterium]|nr:Smr/MutS family protein [Alphaproteobacteria bacterium]MBU1829960.1 Smr/MutS family protein [Alphaproteobacteria bacterium]